MRQFDNYIFDMDGTLWDAVDSYCIVWNRTIADCGLSVPPVTRPRLESLMGKPLEIIFDNLIGVPEAHDRFMSRLSLNEKDMMPALGGKLYPGVRDTIATLASRGRVFMVSNCEASGLPNFLDFSGLRPYMTDFLSFGSTGHEKDVNIRCLVERYNLENAVYVGDTSGDLASTHRAGLPFVWASYGFGRDVKGYDYRIDSISELLE